jgi:hypothetical protein
VPRKGKKVVKWVSVRVTPAMYDEVRQLAEEEHRSVNGTIQEAIERYLRSRRGRQPKDLQDGR